MERARGGAGASLIRLAAALLAGVLVVLAFPRFGYDVGLDHLVWVCLVPLFLAAAGQGLRRGFLLGWTAGVVLEGAGFIWILAAIRNFTTLGRAGASLVFALWLLYAAVPWGLLGAALGACRRPAGVLAVLPFFVAVEHFFPRLFAWHLGGALYGRLVLCQASDLAGASGLTALVFLANAGLYLAILAGRGRARFPAATLAALACLLAGVLVYGGRRLEEVERAEAAAPEVRALFVQGCIDPRRRTLEQYLEATRKWLADNPGRAAGLDLILWPEGADAEGFDLTPGSDPWSFHSGGRKPIDALLRRGGSGQDGVALAAGSAAVSRRRRPPVSNVAVFIRPGEAPRFYEKNVPLLFGERVPGFDLLPASWREKLAQVGNIALGTENPLLHLPRGPAFRNLLCYEAVIPSYARASSRGADFLVNLTEDMWYGNTAQIPQHASVLVLRAVENRATILRAANVGPSGVVSATGRFHRGEKVYAPEVFDRTARALNLPTIYEQGGYLFPLAALVVAALLFARKLFRERRFGGVDAAPDSS